MNNISIREMGVLANLALNYEELFVKGRALNNHREDFDALIKVLMQTIDSINNVWSDDASKDFIDKVHQLKTTAFDPFSQLLDSFSTHIDQVHTKYVELQGAIKTSQQNF